MRFIAMCEAGVHLKLYLLARNNPADIVCRESIQFRNDTHSLHGGPDSR